MDATVAEMQDYGEARVNEVRSQHQRTPPPATTMRRMRNEDESESLRLGECIATLNHFFPKSNFSYHL